MTNVFSLSAVVATGGAGSPVVYGREEVTIPYDLPHCVSKGCAFSPNTGGSQLRGNQTRHFAQTGFALRALRKQFQDHFPFGLR